MRQDDSGDRTALSTWSKTRVKITKRSFLVRGLTGTALLFGILSPAANILGLSDWYSHHWSDLLDMDTAPPKYHRKQPGEEATHRHCSESR